MGKVYRWPSEQLVSADVLLLSSEIDGVDEDAC
jgi:hypothetical protein